MKKIFFLSIFAAAVFSACTEDKFNDSIFEDKSDLINEDAFTAPLDSFVKKCFLVPYNVDFKYKMEDISSDMSKNFVPASYQKCKELAVLTKYLWYDVYKEAVPNGELLMKKYSPRIIHVVGSKNVNPNTGTEVLGETASGIMITLFRANTLNVNDLNYSNEYFFKTMHHEFGHMMCSNYVVPTDYRKITPTTYDALSWQETCDSVALGQGYISQYSRNNYEDDFVEMFSVFVTSTDREWNERLSIAQWTWEEKEVPYKYWSEKIKPTVQLFGANIDTVGYLKSVSQRKDDKCTIVRKRVKREDLGDDAESTQYAHAIPDADGNIQYEGEGGLVSILAKFTLLDKYLHEKYNMDIYELRREINRRSYYTDTDGNIMYGSDNKPMNRVKDELPKLLNDLEYYNF